MKEWYEINGVAGIEGVLNSCDIQDTEGFIVNCFTDFGFEDIAYVYCTPKQKFDNIGFRDALKDMGVNMRAIVRVSRFFGALRKIMELRAHCYQQENDFIFIIRKVIKITIFD